MAKDTLTGLTEEELVERRDTYESRREKRGETDERPPFEDRFCLWTIPNQPEDYDGPPRYCMHIATEMQGPRRTVCPVHHQKNFGGAEENLEDPRTAATKHGMNAKLENLRRDFTDKDKALYDWIVDGYADAYDIDVENDPAAAYDLHRLAAEIVRAERGRGWLIREGEVHEKDRYSDEGALVRDKHGDVVTEKSEHYLAGMMHRQDKKLTDLHRELLVSRKERAKNENEKKVADGFKEFSEVGAALLGREENDYDPDDWANATESTDDD